MKLRDLLQILDVNSITEIIAEPGITVFQLSMKSKCFKTDHDARRIIEAGGFYINYQKVTNTEEMIVPGIHIMRNNISLLRVGKKNYHVVRWMT